MALLFLTLPAGSWRAPWAAPADFFCSSWTKGQPPLFSLGVLCSHPMAIAPFFGVTPIFQCLCHTGASTALPMQTHNYLTWQKSPASASRPDYVVGGYHCKRALLTQRSTCCPPEPRPPCYKDWTLVCWSLSHMKNFALVFFYQPLTLLTADISNNYSPRQLVIPRAKPHLTGHMQSKPKGPCHSRNPRPYHCHSWFPFIVMFLSIFTCSQTCLVCRQRWFRLSSICQ